MRGKEERTIQKLRAQSPLPAKKLCSYGAPSYTHVVQLSTSTLDSRVGYQAIRPRQSLLGSASSPGHRVPQGRKGAGLQLQGRACSLSALPSPGTPQPCHDPHHSAFSSQRLPDKHGLGEGGRQCLPVLCLRRSLFGGRSGLPDGGSQGRTLLAYPTFAGYERTLSCFLYCKEQPT